MNSSTTNSSEQLQLVRFSHLRLNYVCIGSHTAITSVGWQEKYAAHLGLEFRHGA